MASSDTSPETELNTDSSTVASQRQTGPSQGTATVATERHMWQIFTDENGDIQKHSVPVGIVKNPFETEDAAPSNGNASNPFKGGLTTETELSTGTANFNTNSSVSPTVVSHETLPPPKPQRSAVLTMNGGSGNIPKNSRVEMGGDVVVFEADKSYTRFHNVDEVHSDEEELGYPLNPKAAEEHHYPNKTLIRSDSDLMLPYIQGYQGNPFQRARRWWSGRHMGVKVMSVVVAMTLSYFLIVLIIVKTLS